MISGEKIKKQKRNGECLVANKKTRFTKMELKLLAEDFYKENGHLDEVMDKVKGNITFDAKARIRGYGVLLIDVEGLKFAIPFRSNIPHTNCFVSKRVPDRNGKIQRMGLDYTKSVIITDQKFVSSRHFRMRDSREYWEVVNNEEQIISEFTEYVEKYKQAILSGDEHIMREHRLSTLKNYHSELGLE